MIRRTRTLINLMKEVSLDEVREKASMPFALVITGPSRELRQKTTNLLSGGASYTSGTLIEHDANTGWSPVFERASLVLYVLDHGQVRQSDLELLGRIARIGLPIIVLLLNAAALVGDQNTLDRFNSMIRDSHAKIKLVRIQDSIETLLRTILQELDAFDIAIARQLPPFRPIVANQLISEASRANAQFALMSNIPMVIPIIGNIAAASADLLVLTKNQIMLVFKLAAVNGQDIHSGRKILAEIIPVVGAGFFWRTVARELADLMPFGVGAIPKTIIAYAGTFVVGRSAQYYYSTGLQPSNDLLRKFYSDALERARKLFPKQDAEHKEQTD